METKCNEDMDSTTNMDTSEKMITNNDEEFSDDFAQMSDFENQENEEAYDQQRFQTVNRGNFRCVCV